MHFQLELGELAHLKLVVLGQRGRSPKSSSGNQKGRCGSPFGAANCWRG